jgi:hypothetical protein
MWWSQSENDEEGGEVERGVVECAEGSRAAAEPTTAARGKIPREDREPEGRRTVNRRWVPAADSGAERSVLNLPATAQTKSYQRARAAGKHCGYQT